MDNIVTTIQVRIQAKIDRLSQRETCGAIEDECLNASCGIGISEYKRALVEGHKGMQAAEGKNHPEQGVDLLDNAFRGLFGKEAHVVFGIVDGCVQVAMDLVGSI